MPDSNDLVRTISSLVRDEKGQLINPDKATARNLSLRVAN
jgi:hypothetical protein